MEKRVVGGIDFEKAANPFTDPLTLALIPTGCCH